MNDVEEYLRSLGGPRLLKWHHDNGSTRTAEEYLGLYRDLLTRGLRETQLIYLDTNFWVRLRDAHVGKGSSEALKLLQVLRAKVRSRESLCVSQLNSFLEVGKQTGGSLRASADLMDELTEGIGLAAPPDLLVFECALFVEATLGRNVSQGLSPWTKVGLIHRNDVPDKMPGPATAEEKEAILKAATDSLWQASFGHVFERFGWDTKSRLNSELDAEVLAKVADLKVSQLARGLSRDEVRRFEFSSVAGGQLRPVLAHLLRRWHRQRNFPEGIVALLRDIQKVEATAVEQFVNRTLGRMLPGLSLQTELFCLYQLDPQRTKPLTTNDWFDWSHASVAMPYCDVFLTERGLAHRLRQELHADVRYECEVIGTIEEAVQRLNTKPRHGGGEAR